MMPLLIGLQLIAWIAYLPLSMRGLADFRTLYAAAYMTRTHQGHEIYENTKLLEVKERVAPLGIPFLQPMDHPAYETLLFLPLTYLTYRRAFLAFAGINLCVLVLCVWLLWPVFRGLSKRWTPLPLLLFAGYFPITRAITQGQDSVLLLALLAGTIVCLRRGQEFNGGMLTGVGLFKFQIVIPIAVLFLIWKRWRFALGFGVASAAALLVSWVLVGTRGTRQYIGILLDMSLKLRTPSDALRSAISPRTMLNLRGLLDAIVDRHIGSWWLQILIAAGSLAIVWIAVRCRPSLPLAIMAAALVSYHLNVQDASILIIPIGLSLSSESVYLGALAVAAVIFPITAIWPMYGFLGAIPFLGLYLVWQRVDSGYEQLMPLEHGIDQRRDLSPM
jgi:hypothetical protein